jgi:diguanylate cyclase (GGDEF)-like protein
VLKEFGYLLKQTVAIDGATLARYGGDEFVVILPGHDLEQAETTASEVQNALRRTKFLQGSFSWSDGPVYWREPLTCSIGVAVYPVHLPRQGTTDMKKNLLLRAADLAMYDAKAAGKNNIFVAE